MDLLKNKVGLLLVVGSVVVACGGDESSTSLVIAAQGGTVTVSGANIVIPPGALEADTEVTIRIGNLDDYGPLVDGRPNVLVVEPAGTTLNLAAIVTFGPGGTLDPADSVRIMQFVDGNWYPPEISSAEVVGENQVQATLWVFGPTAVVVPQVQVAR